MRTRHRTPTIFNLSMVDVLCCALGCVILLWLLNLREARERAIRAGDTNHRLLESQRALDETTTYLLGTVRERDDLAREADDAARSRDRLRGDLAAARAEHEDLARKLAALRRLQTETDSRVAMLTHEQRTLLKEKADTAERLTNLDASLRDKENKLKMSARRAEDLAAELRDADARIKRLQEEVDDYRARLTAAESKAKTLETDSRSRETDLAAANRNIDRLVSEKKDLAEQVSRARAAVENRFEGIALTGRRVVFLVDMSGSMELVDERTPDANKWVGVRETLAKVMRSLPDLEKFQVVLFSDRVTYLLGEEGRWIGYDPKTSVGRVVKELAGVKPLGATNMYDAFETAFKFRADGLDTIYVLSDGLPNIGPGLTPEQATNPKETERSEILARHIRNLLRRDWNRELMVQPRVRINTIGFFYESPDVGAFLWALARENDGSFVGMSKP
jgi:hypothetical protein